MLIKQLLTFLKCTVPLTFGQMKKRHYVAGIFAANFAYANEPLITHSYFPISALLPLARPPATSFTPLTPPTTLNPSTKIVSPISASVKPRLHRRSLSPAKKCTGLDKVTNRIGVVCSRSA